MPYSIRKVNGKKCYRVTNRKTKRVFSYCTPKNRAIKQLRLLRALEYNPRFVPLGKTRKNRK